MSDQLITIETLKNGALAERFNDAITEVVRNAMDKNTDHRKKRKVVITIEMTPTEDREMLATKLDIKTTLASPKVLETTLAMGFDGSNYLAEEVGNQIVGQRKVDPNTGEITEVGNKLIEMQKRAQGGR